jgi:hypothetical protein
MDHCPGARAFAEGHVAAVHESGNGTKRTWCDVRSESPLRGKAEVGFRGRQVSF